MLALALLGLWSWEAAGGASAAPLSAGPLRVVTSIYPRAVRYGDPVTAEVAVAYDPRTIALASIRVVPSFSPYVAVSAPVVQPVRSGLVRFRYSLLCVSDGCLPTRGPRLLRLEPVTVSGLAGASRSTATATWPVLRISSRLVPSDLRGPVRFRSPTTPPAPVYRVAPGLLAALLLATATLCVLVAIAIAARGLLALRRRPATRSLSSLELAIAYVRDSTRRSAADRRRALGLLAEAVDDTGEPVLAAAAAETAWSQPPPTPAGASELAERAAGAGRASE